VTRWADERKREAFYKQAKREGYRARSSYKLQQINDKFHLIKTGDAVVDLGCSPGGWTQVAVELVGPTGRVVGIDIAFTPPVEGAIILQGDMTKPETHALLEKALVEGGRQGQADVVVSDMSPNITGSYTRDQATSAWLVEQAIAFAQRALKRGGHLVFKIFEGEDFPQIIETCKSLFGRVRKYNPPASRKQSSEVYVIATDYRGGP
jgi:23S rRNA (uridine2552-2'-O)-methyltransferase